MAIIKNMNLTSNIYIGYVVEAIYEDGLPTLNLRVRVPSIHGANAKTGIQDSDLPIARPLLTPGNAVELSTFTDMVKALTVVYIFFEFGDYNKPVYFGVRPDDSDKFVFVKKYVSPAPLTITANNSYTITHNLGTVYVSVTLTDLVDDRIVDTEIEVVDSNNIKIYVGNIHAPTTLNVFVIGY